MDIQVDRLWQHLQSLGKIGKEKDGSVTRLPFTKVDRLAEDKIQAWMREAGLQTRVDGVGNVIATYPGKVSSLPPIICGSHFDSVKQGGIFDGCLGLLAGIEVLQTMKEQQYQPERTILVIGFKDEEGNRFGYGMVGSKAICGLMQPEGFQSKDETGITLYEAMSQAGYTPDTYRECKISPVHAYYELHIEQGRVLERHRMPLGIVEGISGLARYTITIHGESNHAGATVMEDRRDPVVAMCLWVTKITELAKQYAHTVATIGSIRTYPGACNVICDHVAFSLDLRSLRDEVLAAIMQEMNDYQKQYDVQGIRIVMVQEEFLPACPCDPLLQRRLGSICEQEELAAMALVSGAGHDCMNFKDICPTAMLFVRSFHGYSHRKEEFSTKEDCAAGCQVLYRALKDAAKR